MVVTLCLVTCALVTAQPPDRTHWLLTPRLSRGQELVYRGTYNEEIVGQSVRFNRSYRLETSLFVMEPAGRNMNAAVLTVLELRAHRPEKGKNNPAPRSVRLELARISAQGHMDGSERNSLLVPLDGPPTVECGAIVESPSKSVKTNQTWEINEPSRPMRTWKIVGTQTIQNTRCLKLVGLQQSDDWDKPRADRTAWRRTDTVWLSPSAGIAYRVERIIERREPARKQPTQRAVVRYELLSRLTYPGRLYDDRRKEIVQARRFYEEAVPFLTKPGQYSTQLTALLKRINTYLENQPAVDPYRKAVLQVKRRVEAGQRGEASSEPSQEEETPRASVAKLGQRAPDFVTTNLFKEQSVRLYRLLGQPILLVFYNPNSITARDLLLFANAKQKRGVTVLGMAVSNDTEELKKQQQRLKLTFPILAGRGFRVTYGVEVTPRVILLDAKGIVRGTYTGWGLETPGELDAEINKWIKK